MIFINKGYFNPQQLELRATTDKKYPVNNYYHYCYQNRTLN